VDPFTQKQILSDPPHRNIDFPFSPIFPFFLLVYSRLQHCPRVSFGNRPPSLSGSSSGQVVYSPYSTSSDLFLFSPISTTTVFPGNMFYHRAHMRPPPSPIPIIRSPPPGTSIVCAAAMSFPPPFSPFFTKLMRLTPIMNCNISTYTVTPFPLGVSLPVSSFPTSFLDLFC